MGKGILEQKNSRIKNNILSCVVILLCAAVIMCMRMGIIPSTIDVMGIGFPLSDFFIIVGAGLCGYRYGLGLSMTGSISKLCLH